MRLSLLITYYNETTLLTQCLESIDFQDGLEILVYDDASRLPAKDYIPQRLEGNVQVFRSKQNQGPAFGRNQLLEKAVGQYVHFHDADDLFAPDWLTKVFAKIEATQADVIFTGIRSIDENGTPLSNDVMALNQLNEASLDLIKIGLSGSILVPSTTTKRALLLQTGGYASREILPQSEDFHFHLKLALLKPTLSIIKEPLVVQRIRKNSHSHTAGLLVCYQSAYQALELLKQRLSSTYPEDLANAYARIGHILFVLGDKQMAKQAFKASKALYKIDFKNRSKWFQIVASVCGILPAEYISLVVQKIKKYIVFTSRI